jgi:predicted DNA-binding transcriptional regulator AlpA
MRRLRFADLQALGIVYSRQNLAKWIQNYGFPAGQLTGPNTRTWSEEEVRKWLANRPAAPKPTPKSPGRPRKAAEPKAEA